MVLAVGVLSCGSSAAPEAKAPESESEAADSDGEPGSDASSDESDGEGDASADVTAPSSTCADGSCFACGSGVCPAGFYCDESAQGGPGCSWLPTCAPKASCACIERVLTDCSCSESDGAPHVKCG